MVVVPERCINIWLNNLLLLLITVLVEILHGMRRRLLNLPCLGYFLGLLFLNHHTRNLQRLSILLDRGLVLWLSLIDNPQLFLRWRKLTPLMLSIKLNFIFFSHLLEKLLNKIVIWLFFKFNLSAKNQQLTKFQRHSFAQDIRSYVLFPFQYFFVFLFLVFCLQSLPRKASFKKIN